MIVVGLHNARDDRVERFEYSSRVPTLLRVPYQQTSDLSAHVAIEYMDSVLDQRAGVSMKHKRCGFAEQRALHNLSECAEKHSD